MKKYLALIALIAGLIIGAFFQGKSFGKNKAENECKAKVIIQVKEVIKIQNATEKTIIKSKKIAEDNRNLDRDELIDKL
ncbi:MAG: hypothetical protein ACJAY9_000760 [Flavobacteriales bacterium]|jgi:hypothetical protein